jgi:hypothetical protein
MVWPIILLYVLEAQGTVHIESDHGNATIYRDVLEAQDGHVVHSGIARSTRHLSFRSPGDRHYLANFWIGVNYTPFLAFRAAYILSTRLKCGLQTGENRDCNMSRCHRDRRYGSGMDDGLDDVFAQIIERGGSP